jgi:hypothetical protein
LPLPLLLLPLLLPLLLLPLLLPFAAAVAAAAATHHPEVRRVNVISPVLPHTSMDARV